MGVEWNNARRIVVKIGSSLLADQSTGAINEVWLVSLAQDIVALVRDGREIIIVSSGAIALGRHILNLKNGVLRLEESQAAAAVGQIGLAHAYQSIFRAQGLHVAQVLLTLGDTEERRRYLNARNTIATLLKLKALPVVNENDTVATSEIRYGDNDRLAARVASMTSADCLVLLSDVDGLYTGPPGSVPDARRLDRVEKITPEIEAMAGDAGSDLSRGGMVTKLQAARIALEAGTHMVITSGKVMHPLEALSQAAPATWFVASADPVAARKRWIAGSLVPKGRLLIDAGAAAALKGGKSLLPAGVIGVKGIFERGDALLVCLADGTEVARGLTAYGYSDAGLIIGKRSSQISEILGYAGRAEMMHRDDMVLTRR